MSESVAELLVALRTFVDERDWSQFHTPKNLAMAVAGEAGELCAELQWLSDAEIAHGISDGDLRSRLGSEIADVFIYLLLLADASGIDLLDATKSKLRLNSDRYVADVVRGSADRGLREPE